MSLILITGASGQLGKELQVIQDQYSSFEFVFKNRNELDITDEKAVAKTFAELKPNYCINCAAYTAVDKAESDETGCTAVNVNGPAFLANASKDNHTILIHFSSDYIYNIDSNEPLTELETPQPNSVYAKTKLAGDNKIIGINPHSIIIRTSWIYSSFGNNFVKTMIRLGTERDELSIVEDQIGAPTYARDIAITTMEMISQLSLPTNDSLFGIYNYSNGGITNWADFAAKIFQLKNIECRINRISTEEFGAAAHRPRWSVLSHKKINERFNIYPRHWEDSLKECLELM